jgi:hypothetical protein
VYIYYFDLFAIEKEGFEVLVNKWVRVLLFLNAFAQSLKNCYSKNVTKPLERNGLEVVNVSKH